MTDFNSHGVLLVLYILHHSYPMLGFICVMQLHWSSFNFVVCTECFSSMYHDRVLMGKSLDIIGYMEYGSAVCRQVA